MFIYIIIVLFILFIKYCGSRKGFNKLETYWLFYTLVFYLLFFKLNPKQQVILILFIYITNLFIPIMVFSNIFFSIIFK